MRPSLLAWGPCQRPEGRLGWKPRRRPPRITTPHCCGGAAGGWGPALAVSSLTPLGLDLLLLKFPLRSQVCVHPPSDPEAVLVVGTLRTQSEGISGL